MGIEKAPRKASKKVPASEAANSVSTPREPGESLSSWQDWVLTPLVELFLLGSAFLLTRVTYIRWDLSSFSCLVLFLSVNALFTLLFLYILRKQFPFEEGDIVPSRDIWKVYRWKLYHYLSATNLFFHYQNSVLPSILRKFLSRPLGANLGRGLLNIAGWILDPFMIEIEETAVVGHDSLLSPSHWDGERLQLRKIKVGKGAIIGGRSVIMPGVQIGKGAMIMAMSYVSNGTVIPPFEIWGGNPAKKVGEVKDKNLEFNLFDWRDQYLTPIISTLVYGISIGAGFFANRIYALGAFEIFLSFYLTLQISTLLCLWIIRTYFPLKGGTYSFTQDPQAIYLWKLTSFLTTTNLGLHYFNGLLPGSVRSLFYPALGAKLESTAKIIPVSGVMLDPYMVQIEKGGIVTHGSLLAPHIASTESLTLLPIRISKGAILGARSILMPGVHLAESSQIEPMSLVRMGTQVGPGEVWQGVPAKLIRKKSPQEQQKKFQFLTVTDFFSSAALQIGLLSSSLYFLYWARSFLELDLFESLCAFGAINTILTLLVLGFLRRIFNLRRELRVEPGESNRQFFFWKFYRSIVLQNLFFFEQSASLPLTFRSFVYRILGAQVPLGLNIFLAGDMDDPQQVTIGKGSYLSHDSLIMSSCTDEIGQFYSNRVLIGDQVLIGPKAYISPGVTIESYAVIEPLSFLLPDTHVKFGEIWSGNPAVCIGNRQAKG